MMHSSRIVAHQQQIGLARAAPFGQPAVLHLHPARENHLAGVVREQAVLKPPHPDGLGQACGAGVHMGQCRDLRVGYVVSEAVVILNLLAHVVHSVDP
jgi:hypothetical protein